jgi:peptidoglycan/LPS O-acetylase OafA/YrhL
VLISLVIISHYAKDIGCGDPFDLGSLGVRIFFVISGSLITGLLLRELERDGRISSPRFYFRRTMRIFPAFYFYLVCMLLAAHFGWTELSFRDAIPALTYTSNYSLSLQPIIKHTWSLATEEQFYLIWPAVLAISKPRRGIPALMLLLIVAPVSSHLLASRLGHSVPAFFNDPIGIGCLLALIRRRLDALASYRHWARSQLGLLLPFLILIGNLPVLHVHHVRDEIFSLLLNILIAL